MIKQIILPLIGAALFIILVGVLVKRTDIKIPQSDATQKSLTIGSKTIPIEVAKTKEERTLGLSGKKSIPEDYGMLFVFDTQNVTPGFWMKDMLIPIDIIWINDGHVVKIDKNIPPPEKNAPDDKLQVYVPGTPIDYVLEVNAGFSDKNGIKVEDLVTLPAL